MDEAAQVKNILPFMQPVWRALAPYAYTLIRVATGAIFVPHGVQKLSNGNIVLGALELAGGLLIAVGFLPRIVAVLLALDVLWIITLNIGKGWLWTRGGVQYHVFLLGLLLSVMLAGGGLHAITKEARENLVHLGYTLARIWMALLILPSGWEKVFDNGVARIAAGNLLKTGFYPPMFWAWVVAWLELAGMIMLAAGLLTRPIAFMFFVEMAVITVTIQMPNGYFWTSRGCEFALLLTVVSFAFVMGGGGKYSLDRRIGREF
ncbi:MAG TPA: DoxX family protein [Burkholderiales bacterium]|nr:DoxX family protein [Burkholderiales bacterium]